MCFGKTVFFTKIFLAFVFAICCRCAYAKPDWISGESRKYPSDQYLIGIGVGADIDASRANARAEISKIFSAKISQVMEEVTSERTGMTGPQVSVEQKTRVTVEDVLEGVEIARIWRDKKNKVVYSLAVLNKKKYRQNMSNRMAAAEEAISGYLERAKTESSAVEKLRLLTVALKSAAQRDAFAIRRSVVESVPLKFIQDELSTASIISAAAQTKKKIKFVIFVDSPDDKNTIKEAFAEKITASGFDVVAAENSFQAADILAVFVDIRYTPFNRDSPGWKFYMWEGRFEIRSGEKTLASASLSGVESHTTQEGALLKSRLAAEKAMVDMLARKIDHIFSAE